MGVTLGELEVLDLVATGGMAEVYRARLNGRLLAIKRILPQFTREKDLLQMFVDEARVASQLRHPAVVRVYDLGLTDGGEFYILMEYADGRDLSDVLYAAGLKNLRFTPGLCVYAARQVLSALHYAHNAVGRDGRPMNLIHRDISPHNVMAGFDGWVKLTDFGIAKVQHSGHQTMAGVVKGKFGYMSPEQARGKKLDGRSDLYNVGILLYEMVTGDRLFAGSSDISTLDRMRAAEVPALPRELGCPPQLEQVIRTALQKAPEARYPDAATFDAALADVEARAGIRGTPQEMGRLVTQLYGSSRVPAPERPTKPAVALRSATAQRPEDSELVAPAPPPSRTASSSRIPQVAPPGRTVSGARLPAVAPPTGRTVSGARLQAVAPPPAPAFSEPPRTNSGSRNPAAAVGGAIRSTLPQLPAVKAAAPAAKVVSAPRLAPVASPPAPVERDTGEMEAYEQEENTRFEALPADPSQVVLGGRKPTAPQVPAAPAIMTKASVQALPVTTGVRAHPHAQQSSSGQAVEMPPSTQQEGQPAPLAGGVRIAGTMLKPLGATPSVTNMPVAQVAAPAAQPVPGNRVIQTSARLAPIKDPPSNPQNKLRKPVVWEEPSLSEESARLESPAAGGPAAPPLPPMAAPARPARAPLPPPPVEDVSADRTEEAGQVSAEDDKERKKREALERIRAKKAAKAAGLASEGADATAEAPPPPTEDAAEAPPADEDEKARKKREALERIRAKKAAKAAAAAGGEEPSDEGAAAAPPADEDEKARKKREALERIRAKKAAKAAGGGEDAEAPVAADGGADAPAEGVSPPTEEWRTRPDAPPSAPHPDRAGKVLEDPLTSYARDVRPLARRGAWIIGEPGISPVDQSAGARRRDLASKLLPSSTRRRAFLLAMGAAAAGYMLAARRGADVARLLGPAATFLVANVAASTPNRGEVALTVLSTPPGAKVVLDGEAQAGQTPLTLRVALAPGDHKVLVIKGKQKKEVSFTSAADEPAVLVDAALSAEPSLDVRLDHVAEASLWVDGNPVKDVEAFKRLPRGVTHHVEVRVGDRPAGEVILAPDRAGRTVLAPVTAGGATEVVVVSQPPATVWLGKEQLAQVTGLQAIKVPTGKPTLTLRVPGAGLSRDLVVDATGKGGLRRYHVELLP